MTQLPQSIGMIQTSAASGLDDFVRARGGDPAGLRSRSGLDGAALDDPQRSIPLSAYAGLLEEAARETRSPVFGLEFGQTFEPTHLGPVGHLLSHGRTLGSALDNFSRYFAALQSKTDIALTVSGDLACMRYAVRDSLHYEKVQDAEFSIAFLFGFCRRVAGSRWRARSVAFEHACRGDSAYHRQFFAVPVNFSQATNAFFFPASLLDAGIPAADPLLTDFLERHLAEVIAAEQARGDLLGRVESSLLLALRRGRDLGPEAIAADLGMSVRTLQRRLDAAGSSFSELRARARMVLARSHLADSGMSITEIALALGFSETSAFSRAFRTATGEAPMTYRRRATRR